MMGDGQNKGLMLQAVEDLFNRIEHLSKDRDYKCSIQYLEVYNEVIKDLLNVTGDPLDLREDPI